MTGVYIRDGLSDWQIIQQKDGFGMVSMNGFALVSGERSDFKIIARVTDEAGGGAVTEWYECETGDAAETGEKGVRRAEWRLTGDRKSVV